MGVPAGSKEVVAKRERDSAKHKSKRRTEAIRTVGPMLINGVLRCLE